MDKTVISYDNMVSEDRRADFDRLLELLLDANSRMNLTAIRTAEGVRDKHFADSLAISIWDRWPDCSEGGRILDLGTGGGFPGLPLKIAFPKTDITMLDSVRKKLGFIDGVIEEMKLTGARTLWSRAEDAGRGGEHRGRYDLVVSRAVAYLPSLIECAVPFLKEGGFFIAYKQADNDQEIVDAQAALKALNADIQDVIPYRLQADTDSAAGGDKLSGKEGTPGEVRTEDRQRQGERRLVIIRKKGPTPERYPRRAGKPMKSPIV